MFWVLKLEINVLSRHFHLQLGGVTSGVTDIGWG